VVAVRAGVCRSVLLILFGTQGSSKPTPIYELLASAYSLGIPAAVRTPTIVAPTNIVPLYLPHVADHEAALRCGRQPRQVYGEVLCWHLVFHELGQEAHRPLYEFDRDPLDRASVVIVMVTTTLRDKVEGTPIRLAEPFEPKLSWPIPYPSIAGRAVQVKEHPGSPASSPS